MSMICDPLGSPRVGRGPTVTGFISGKPGNLHAVVDPERALAKMDESNNVPLAQ